jgi:hypothetical protein
MIPICHANVVVSPAEIYITMIDEYVDGNTSKKIFVTNHNSYNVSVTAWMTHPDPAEWIRSGRTFIDNLGWITINPSKLIIPADSFAYFYIDVSIPIENKNESYDKHWESWATLKIEDASGNASSSFKEGYLVRIYVDTPQPPDEPDDSPLFSEQLLYDTIIAFSVAVIITLIYFYYRRKKKN